MIVAPVSTPNCANRTDAAVSPTPIPLGEIGRAVATKTRGQTMKTCFQPRGVPMAWPAILNTPIDIDPDLTLLNSLAHRKAKEMLANTQEYF